MSAPLLAVLGVIHFQIGSEADIVQFFQAERVQSPQLASWLAWFTSWGNSLFYVIYAVMVFRAFRSRDTSRKRFVFVWLGAQLVIALLAVHFTKMTIGRPRPGQGEWFEPLTTRGAQHSLPSGHTTEFTGWTLPLGLRYCLPWLSVLLGILLAVMGFSRVYLGWHHPSDVFFGWLLGSVTGLAVTLLAPRKS
ncbi:phosphatase PAP2 family protein [Pseudodesulfovibrio tunisiensis]|uniref:phosphatase PAP2 family protein n=1 Tax=Pseudodesulfovibrio tunisiensis TaxID=463192 RepID=UPI001FB4A1F4|nr:phosphatase PAP2 family protein [Pseudodesulfovibrio tunisiensis]